MGRNKTLNDLSDFLNDNPQQINFKSPSSKAEYLKSEPNSLVDVPQIKEHQPKADWSALSPSEIASTSAPVPIMVEELNVFTLSLIETSSS